MITSPWCNLEKRTCILTYAHISGSGWVKIQSTKSRVETNELFDTVILKAQEALRSIYSSHTSLGKDSTVRAKCFVTLSDDQVNFDEKFGWRTLDAMNHRTEGSNHECETRKPNRLQDLDWIIDPRDSHSCRAMGVASRYFLEWG